MASQNALLISTTVFLGMTLLVVVMAVPPQITTKGEVPAGSEAANDALMNQALRNRMIHYGRNFNLTNPFNTTYNKFNLTDTLAAAPNATAFNFIPLATFLIAGANWIANMTASLAIHKETWYTQ